MVNKYTAFALIVVLLSSFFVICCAETFAQSGLTPVANVPITITNNQDVATPNPFQAMITVDSAQYSTYEASDLSNVVFTLSDGTVVPSWLESGNSNSATNTIYWVKIASIAAGGSTTIFMNFLPTTTNAFTSQTGEAPDLSNTRGQYDNGANIFIIYADFLSGFNGWQPYEFSGNFVPTSTVSGVELLSGGGEQTYIVPPITLPAIPMEFEEGWSYNGGADLNAISAFGNSPFGTSNGIIQPDNAPSLSNSITAIFDYYRAQSFLYQEMSTTNNEIGSGSFTGSGNFYVVSFLSVNASWASMGYAIQTVNLEGAGSAQIPTIASGNIPDPLSNNYCLISSFSGGISSVQYCEWFIARAEPPNGIMPSIAFGTLESGGNYAVPSPTPSPTATPSPTPTPTPAPTPSPTPASTPTYTATPTPTTSATPPPSSTPSPTPLGSNAPTPTPTSIPTQKPSLAPTNSPRPTPTSPSPSNAPAQTAPFPVVTALVVFAVIIIVIAVSIFVLRKIRTKVDAAQPTY